MKLLKIINFQIKNFYIFTFLKPWLFRTCHRRFWNSSNVQSLRWEKFILLFFKNNSRTREYLDFLQAFIEWVKFHINNTWLAIPVAMKGCTWALKRFMNTWNSSTFWFDAILRQRSSIENVSDSYKTYCIQCPKKRIYFLQRYKKTPWSKAKG